MLNEHLNMSLTIALQSLSQNYWLNPQSETKLLNVVSSTKDHCFCSDKNILKIFFSYSNPLDEGKCDLLNR